MRPMTIAAAAAVALLMPSVAAAHERPPYDPDNSDSYACQFDPDDPHRHPDEVCWDGHDPDDCAPDERTSDGWCPDGSESTTGPVDEPDPVVSPSVAATTGPDPARAAVVTAAAPVTYLLPPTPCPGPTTRTYR